MSNVNTLIKWPGGKACEIKYIEHLIPKFDRYIEPFFGGGAMFFFLKPQTALINDISADLIDFYDLVKEQNAEFKKYLDDYCIIFDDILRYCDTHANELTEVYEKVKNALVSEAETELDTFVGEIINGLSNAAVEELISELPAYKLQLHSNALDKMLRTVKNEQKKPFSSDDLKENLITGFTGGTYMHFRDIYNDVHLGRSKDVSKAYRSANFYFIREYCYGSMFRYNSKGEFNIPYGGMSYNRKDFKAKVDGMFSAETKKLFSKADIYCSDFDDFFESVELTDKDFMFLDPPYDTDFSDYEGKDFTQNDQKRLANALKKTKAKFILIIKNTEYISSLYEHDFNILCFDKTYTYNVRSRNNRDAEHLIITNIPVQ